MSDHLPNPPAPPNRQARRRAASRRALGLFSVTVTTLVLGGSRPLGPGDLERWLGGERERHRLAGALREVSGLALDAEGRVWAHDDEHGVVFRLEKGGGAVVERRVLGPTPVRGDFEGLAFDGRRFHLVSSTGTLVSFEPGSTERVERYSVRRTTADGLCEVEGLDFDSHAERLVLVCKTTRVRRWRDHLVLLDVALPGDTDALTMPGLPASPRIVLTPDGLEAAGIRGHLSPSGLARAPGGTSWLVVAARQARILEVGDDGRVLDHARLPSGHPQAEGIVVEEPHLLTLADEGGDGRGRITRYRHPPPTSGSPR